jgi:hypothetical protein
MILVHSSSSKYAIAPSRYIIQIEPKKKYQITNKRAYDLVRNSVFVSQFGVVEVVTGLFNEIHDMTRTCLHHTPFKQSMNVPLTNN